jgi:branched-chain amino acid transport system permease protein
MAWQFILNGFAAGSAYALVALGVALQYRTTGFLNFGHGASIAIGAYLAFFLSRSAGLPLALAAIAAIVAAAMFGGLSQRLVYSPLQKKGAPSTVLLIASLGVYTVVQNMISLIAGNDVQTLIANPVGIAIWGARLSPIQITSIVFAVVMFTAFWWVTSSTSVGKQWRAVGIDRELARAHGINLLTIDWTVASVSGAVGALAGIMMAADVSLFPTIGFKALLMGVVAAVIGGLLTPKAAFIGGITVGLVQYLVAGVFSTRWQEAGIFVLLLFVLLIRPKGLSQVRNGTLKN